MPQFLWGRRADGRLLKSNEELYCWITVLLGDRRHGKEVLKPACCFLTLHFVALGWHKYKLRWICASLCYREHQAVLSGEQLVKLSSLARYLPYETFVDVFWFWFSVHFNEMPIPQFCRYSRKPPLSHPPMGFGGTCVERSSPSTRQSIWCCDAQCLFQATAFEHCHKPMCSSPGFPEKWWFLRDNEGEEQRRAEGREQGVGTDLNLPGTQASSTYQWV